MELEAPSRPKQEKKCGSIENDEMVYKVYAGMANPATDGPDYLER